MSSDVSGQPASGLAAGTIRVVDLTQTLNAATPVIGLPPPNAPSKPFSMEDRQAGAERLGPQAMRTDARVVGFTQTPSGVEVDIAASDGRTTTVAGDALIGADGIHSALRAVLVDEDPGARPATRPCGVRRNPGYGAGRQGGLHAR